MERANRGRRWANLKQRLGLKGMGCCRGSWSPTSSTLTMIEGFSLSLHGSSRSQREDGGRSSAASGMNLAMALAAERNLRSDEGGPTGASDVKSLMRLFEEMDGGDWKTKRKEGENNGDWMCCVCMERSKGAAFIPCGHTFCRVCSRELWLNRGTCPICSRSIIEILDIF
ncbi:hypothetical protein IC582_010030 [Cucumis melo]|uniref:Uncharacterized protein LOC127149384 n=2 Tax=Cucumis melo TaxID=3656 RepID=A0A9I9D8N8_CUCME|nr:uncharacterized protein LOC127149384 [Cucumis melo]KAA0061653.1 zf-C3HC4_3 domain-containing protein [Cucumis melo var. makuwa]TYK05853.1 zf-C3HC4_3 domain-containing protein [Cucumis melo var. makuwa]